MRPRLLAIMGSGETAPTLAKVHRALLARLGPERGPAVLVDTPYGFQENADEISGRTVEYFRESVGAAIGVASFRAAGIDPVARATAAARIGAADFVFTGPGSPSYALRQWRGSEIPDLLAGKLERGGALVFASAAALTLGAWTVPVYEIYKVGEEPHWLDGLDLLGPLGFGRVAVIPHYDNAEGGSHDTRFCYLGERRLERLEAELPAEAWILGIDSHTALVLDLVAGTAAVAGNGGVTVRAHGRSTVFPAGSEVAVAELTGAAKRVAGAADAGTVGGVGPERGTPTPPGAGGVHGPGGLLEALADAETRFERSVAAGDAPGAVAAVLELDTATVAWSRDTGDAGEQERARAVLRSLVVRLGELAAVGTRDPREAVEPFVEALLELRERARTARDWAAADLVRDRLTAAGIEVRDGADGSAWSLAGDGAEGRGPRS